MATPKTLLTPTGRWMFRILDVCAVVFWLYAIVKIFFFDIDAFVLQTAFPAHAWLLNLWFLFIVIALAVALICSDRGSVFFWCDYIILFPLVVLLWKIPRMMAATGEPSGVIH